MRIFMHQRRFTQLRIATLTRKIIVCLSLALMILAVLFLYQSSSNRDVIEAGTVNGAPIASSDSTNAGLATVMSAAQMGNFTGTPSVPPAGAINRPTIPLDEYNALKAMATSGGPKPRGASSATVPAAPAFTTNFQGAVQGENGKGFVPPDVDSAVGPTQILQPTNSSLDVWSKAGVHLRSLSLNGFVGNFTDSLGDSSAMYDPDYNRWVVLIDDFSNLTGSGKPQYYIAVSQTGDATGAFFIFPVFFNVGTGNFFDYPHLGMNGDALLLTVNLFNNSTGAFIGPYMWAIPKQKAYNGLGFSVPAFAAAASTGTIMPPFQINTLSYSQDFFVAAPVGASKTALLKFTMVNSDRSNVSVSGPVSIPLPTSYTTPPPNASQTCTGSNPQLTLDTLDGRFQNRSYQYGGYVWQVNTVTLGSFPAPRFYQLRGDTNTTVQTGLFFLSGTSYDFNPHIAANSASSAMVTFSATDPTNAKNAQVMFGGRTSATPLNSMPVGVSLASSTTCLVDNFDPNFNRQRWGDYSVVNLDSSNLSSGIFWITNEYVIGNSSNATDHWATQFARVTP